MAIELSLLSAFLRTLGLVAPLVGQPGVTTLANAAATLLDAGEDGIERLKTLTNLMKGRQEAGITTTAEEILAEVDRVKALDQKIQDIKGNGQ